jgi:hypothetical protein
MADRIWEVPNPYEFYRAPPPTSLIDPAPPPLPESERERRYFELTDSGDWMGLPLLRNVKLDVQVEFVGPAEDPALSRRIIAIPYDPYHPAFLLPTAGLSIRF